jgi:hypothetical protein
MNPILNTGLLIGVLCAVWMFVCGVTGWYKDPALNLLFFLVIPIENRRPDLGTASDGARRVATTASRSSPAP